MPNMIDQTDREIFHTEMINAYQRRDPEFSRFFMNKGVPAADKFSFDINGLVAPSKRKNRDSKIHRAELDLGRVSFTSEEEFSGEFKIDDFDKFRHNPNLQSTMAGNAVDACNLGQDIAILNMLKAATETYNSNNAFVMDSFGRLLGMEMQLQLKDIFTSTDQLICFCTPAMWNVFKFKSEEVKNKDYAITNESFAPLREGAKIKTYPKISDTVFVKTNKLEGTGTNAAQCYLFDPRAVCWGDDGAPQSHMYYVDNEDAHAVWAKHRYAGGIALPEGVVKFRHDDVAATALLV